MTLTTLERKNSYMAINKLKEGHLEE